MLESSRPQKQTRKTIAANEDIPSASCSAPRKQTKVALAKPSCKAKTGFKLDEKNCHQEGQNVSHTVMELLGCNYFALVQSWHLFMLVKLASMDMSYVRELHGR